MVGKVLASFEDRDRALCVDVFIRADGSDGFEAFRRASDGDARWQSLARYGQRAYASGEQALREAQWQVAWLALSQVGRWRW